MDVSLLHPKPVFILIAGEEDEWNPMALSWATPVDEDEGIIAVVLWTKHKTYDVLKRKRVFTLNIVHDIQTVWNVGSVSGWKKDKRGIVEVIPGKKVGVRAKNALAWLECEVIDEKLLGESAVVFARIVHAERTKDYNVKRVPLHVRGRLFAFPGKLVRV